MESCKKDNKTMKEIGIEERKNILIQILDFISDFTEKNNIRCYLHAGTLLGAVRHNGFIPWDDDIDVSMPRPDYEKFKKIFTEMNSDFYIADYNNMKFYPTPFIKLCYKNTDCFINNKKCGYGIGIDIFPIDGYPDDELERNKWFDKQKQIFSKKYMKNVMFELYDHCGRNFIWYAFKKFKNICCTSQKGARLVDDNSKKNTYETSKYAGCSVGIFRSKIELAKRESFDSGIKMLFEGKEYLGPVGYDDILKSIYGNDYMTPPPENKRQTTHDETYFWTNK